ncbi:hypothetical protein [Rhizobium skierniewicense]|uniref:hypothetical protein n=1 Tax=Rhizobium skierniewicense TaxID=984260 RepID=UPI001573772D|nr:hypothetical protein [Rhizobium skierniewicense]NTF31461.1 hypothetical protein [Rhizobium skierniewicense]
MIGFIVEGHMEEKIIRHFCGGAEVRRLQINGCKFPVPRIAERITPHISLLRRKKVHKVVVIIDREQRDETSEQFENDILDAILKRNAVDIPVQITSPDRNFESWIVPFLNANCDVSSERQDHFEGRNGKSIIRAKFKARGEAYVEVVDGIRLFKKVRPEKLKEASLSFRRFAGNFNEDCWWLRQCGEHEPFE